MNEVKSAKAKIEDFVSNNTKKSDGARHGLQNAQAGSTCVMPSNHSVPAQDQLQKVKHLYNRATAATEPTMTMEGSMVFKAVAQSWQHPTANRGTDRHLSSNSLNRPRSQIKTLRVHEDM
jgi:hypothetical protein|tara:strand:- start:234 stop:593 length:360 start_codon:yes stop_codon:yes gene_type:complete